MSLPLSRSQLPHPSQRTTIYVLCTFSLLLSEWALCPALQNYSDHWFKCLIFLCCHTDQDTESSILRELCTWEGAEVSTELLLKPQHFSKWGPVQIGEGGGGSVPHQMGSKASKHRGEKILFMDVLK